MKPRNKHERRIVELSSALTPLTDIQIKWAKDNSFDYSVARSRNSLYCLECAASWKEENRLHTDIAGCICPKCEKDLKIRREPTSTVYSDKEYMAFIDVIDGFQVIRIVECIKFMRKKYSSEISVDEVLQQWIDQNGKVTIMAKNLLGQSAYADTWISSSELSIKDSNTYYGEKMAYSVNPYLIHPKIKVIPIIKRNGFKGNFHHISPRKLFSNLINNPIAETLIKAKQFELLKYYCAEQRHTNRFWNSIKICIRNGYKVKQPSDWFDMLVLLDFFGKDLLNPKYICPENLHKYHNYWVEKKRIWQKKKTDQERFEKIQQSQLQYEQTHGKYFNLEFSKQSITIKFLNTIQQFADASDILKHCIFENEYYEKKNSLCFAAYHKNELVETIEFNIERIRVEQSRGLNNKRSKYNTQIIELIESNTSKILETINKKA
jgi:hypothetical protein